MAQHCTAGSSFLFFILLATSPAQKFHVVVNMKFSKIAALIVFIASFAFLLSFAGRQGGLSSQKINYSDSSLKSYLALGDSYTIGESVPTAENYPHQLTEALKRAGIKMNDPEIRAVTGWTTGDLIASLRQIPPQLKKYDLVTLLIGVNNQYQGRTLNEYGIEFRFLLNEAISYAGDKKNVIVISIPDYSVTPFADGSDTAAIAKEIDTFNAAQKKICTEEGVKFIDITPISRKGKKDGFMQAADGLHPSDKQYAEWVVSLAPKAKEVME